MKPFAFSFFNALRLVKEDAYCSIYEGRIRHINQKHRLFVYSYPFLKKGAVQRLIEIIDRYRERAHPLFCSIWLNLYDGERYFISVAIDEYQCTLRELDLKKRGLDQALMDSLRQGVDALYERHLFLGVLHLDTIFLHQDGHFCLLPGFVSTFALYLDQFSLDYIDSGMIFSPGLLLGKKPNKEEDMFCVNELLSWLQNQKVSANVSQDLKKRVSHMLSLKTDTGAVDQQTKAMLMNRLGHLKKRERITTFILGFCFSLPILILMVFLFSFKSIFIQTPDVNMPNLVGVSIQEASKQLEEKKFRVKVVGSRHHPIFEKDVVVETKPPPGRLVKEKRLVRLFLSKGPLTLSVPNLQGRLLNETGSFLNNIGLDYHVVQRTRHLFVEKGAVVFQFPEAEESIQAGVPLQLVVSDGFLYDVQKESGRFFFGFSDDVKIRVIAPTKAYLGYQVLKIVSHFEDHMDVLYDKLTDFTMPFDEHFFIPKGAKLIFFVQDKEVFSLLEKDL